MFKLSKKHIPLLYLSVICLFWGYFYQTSFWLNDYGRSQPEWLLLLDGLLVLPILCFICIKDQKEAAIKSVVYACIVILLGSAVIPESAKFVWHYLEAGRYLAVAAFVILEITTILTVVLAVKVALDSHQDPDLAISQPVHKLVGQSPVASLIIFEARVWTYTLFAKRVNSANFSGHSHFYGDLKDGTKSNLLGFIFINGFELPLMHLLLHYAWSPLAANVISFLTLLGLLFFIAEYRAISIRPISLCTEKLIIRYGTRAPFEVAYADINSIHPHEGFVRRKKGVHRFNLFGDPNVKIELNSGETVFLGLNRHHDFIEQITPLINK